MITKEADEREVRYKLENIESTQCNKTRKSNQSKIYSYSVIREYKIILIINIRFNMCVCVFAYERILNFAFYSLINIYL